MPSRPCLRSSNVTPTKRYQLLLSLVLAFAASQSTACGEDAQSESAVGGSSSHAGSGSGSTRLGASIGGNGFNQCGVAAPLPTDTGKCTALSAPKLTDFDDYAGTSAASYAFYVNAQSPAADGLLGALQHIGDGSDQNGGTSTIATEMVTGMGDAGYAVQVSNSSATHWGGLLMFFFPSDGTTTPCLNASGYGGVAFAIKGKSPSGRFGVSLGMLDTIPSTEKGLCNNAASSDCKDASVELTLPTSADAWLPVEVPWGAFTPGIGSDNSCVPVTGQNIVRLVIQPFMSYPPPNYTFAPGPYSITVDNVRFY